MEKKEEGMMTKFQPLEVQEASSSHLKRHLKINDFAIKKWGATMAFG